MVVKKLDDPRLFLEAAGSLLLENEARNNLVLGLAGTLRDHPSVYDEHRLWVVEETGRIVAAALRTPPYNLVLAGPATQPALTVLAARLYDDGVELPGVIGSRPEVEHFVEAWLQLTAQVARPRRAQRIYQLGSVRPVAGVSGEARSTTDADRPLLVEWIDAFTVEVVPSDTPDRGSGRIVDAQLREGAGGFTVWEDGEPVSLAGWGGRTPNGYRIGPVYTPPEYRRRGCGSAVTAAVSAERLAAGAEFCFLYTDLANPTSNKIYMDIGYEPVCDSIDHAFESAPG